MSSSVQILEMFSGVYAVPTIILMKICCFISSSIFKCVYGIWAAVFTVLCMVNLRLGYHQPANHYILDLRPEYGDDIVEIASAIFRSFTDQLPFLTKTKRRDRRGKIKTFIKKRGWRPQMVRKRKVRRRNSHIKFLRRPVTSLTCDIISQPSTSDKASSELCAQEKLIMAGPVQDMDTTVHNIESPKVPGQSNIMVEFDGKFIPGASINKVMEFRNLIIDL